MGAVDAISARKGWKHRKWRKAMMDACRHVARNDGFHLRRVPMQSALIAMRDFERINGVEFNPFDRLHCFMIGWLSRHARLFWSLKRANIDSEDRKVGDDGR